MRGKVMRKEILRIIHGITPAYAGKSLLKLLHHVGLRDHPRVCGEKGAPVPNVPVAAGSPPRMRGKVPRNLTDYQTRRITPAYAGKSGLSSKNILQVKDHPRVCGEKVNIGRDNNAPRGSPPRMRGKAFPGRLQGSFPGITPAYAGKRPGPQVRREGCQDHPRVCGEKYWRHSRFI